jgi:hypothetical protein
MLDVELRGLNRFDKLYRSRRFRDITDNKPRMPPLVAGTLRWQRA